MIFHDRAEAGKLLAEKLKKYKFHPDCIVLGLPRGGVITAYEIAKALKLPLDILCPRKIGAPFNPEYAIGAITETGKEIFDRETIEYLSIPPETIKKLIEEQKKIAAKRLKTYRGNRPIRNLKDKIALIVDDGIATGATMKAAILTAKEEGAKSIVVAVPVSPRDTMESIEKMVNEVVYLDLPLSFQAVGQFYRIFDQTEDEEVITLMEEMNEQEKGDSSL